MPYSMKGSSPVVRASRTLSWDQAATAWSSSTMTIRNRRIGLQRIFIVVDQPVGDPPPRGFAVEGIHFCEPLQAEQHHPLLVPFRKCIDGIFAGFIDPF